MMKKSLILLASALLAAFALTACNTDVDSGTSSSSKSSVKDKGTGSLVGVVLDNRGEPVEGALVTLGDRSTKTNKGGEFELTGIDLNDPALVGVKTTVGADGKLTSAKETSLTAANTAYILTVKKDGYLSATVPGMYVSAEENIAGIEDARLASLIANYSDILKEYAKETGNITMTAGNDSNVNFEDDDENKTATMTSIAAALKAIQDIYANLGWSYISTFAECKGLIPLNASLSGSIKLSPTPATDEVYDGTTYVPSYDAKSKKRVKVTYTGSNATNSANYSFFADLDENGNFTFEKLPSGVKLAFAVEEFTDNAGSVSALFSTSKGAAAKEIGTKVDERTVGTTKTTITTVTTATEIKTTTVVEDITDPANPVVTSTITDTVANESRSRPNNYAALLNNNTFDIDNFVIDENALNVDGLKVLLFAQLDKVWVVETNLVANKDDKLLKVTDPITFVFNKEIETATLEGTKALKDVEDKNYSVAIDSSDAKKVTFTPNDGVWTAGSDGKVVKLSVLAKDGTTNLLNNEFTVYLDDKIYVAIEMTSKNDVVKALNDSVAFTFSKAMKTAAVSAKCGNTALTNAFTPSWNEDKTVLTLTPTGFWNKVDDADGEVKFTVDSAVAADDSETVGYWKTNSDLTDKCLKAYFDNKVDVTLAKVSDKEFTLTFSKEIAALTKAELEAAVTITYATVKADAAKDTATAVTDFVPSFDSANKVLTIKAKNADFANTGYYAVKLSTSVVGKTGETKFRKAGTIDAVSTFTTDFTVGPEVFGLTASEFVTSLPATAVASRAFVDAGNYLKLTFNKAIKKSNLKVNGTTVVNYIDGSSIYLPLHGIVDNGDVKLTVAAAADEVTAVDGSTWNKVKATGTSTEYDTGYKVQKNTFKMVGTSLYAETASIAGQNDAKVEKIKPTDNVTFTFDQDVTGATWTAELYDEDTVGVRNLNETLYKVTATPAAKVVTVALTDASKKLDYGKTYYLSLKAVKGTGNDVVVLYDSNAFEKTAVANYAYIPGSTTDTYGSKIVVQKPDTNGKNYIKIEVESKEAKYEKIYVVKAGDNSLTTAFTDFAKSNTSSIVLQFNQPVTGFQAKLVVAGYTLPDTFAAIDQTKVFASEATVSGNVITIKPTYGFPSKTEVVPAVYRDDGKKFDLNLESSGSSATAFLNDSTNKYVSREIADANRDAVITELAGKAELKKFSDLAIVNGVDKTETTDPTNPVDNGAKIEFTFTPEYNSDMSDATYTLFRKKSGSGAKWEEIKTTGAGAVATTNALTVYVDYTHKTGAYDYEARTLLNAKAYFTETDATKSFNYGNISYVLVAKLDNSLVVSNTVVAEDKWCTFTYTPVTADLSTIPLNNDVKLGEITSSDVIRAADVNISAAKNSSGNTLTGDEAYTPYAVQKTSKSVEIYAKKGTRPAAGHKFEVYVIDNHTNKSKSQTATVNPS